MSTFSEDQSAVQLMEMMTVTMAVGWGNMIILVVVTVVVMVMLMMMLKAVMMVIVMEEAMQCHLCHL